MKPRILFRFGLLWALLAFVSACSTTPTTAAGYNASARTKFAKGDFNGAISDSTKAIALASTDPEPYFCRGSAREAQDDFAGAIADYTKVIELDPSNIVAYSNRGFAKESAGDLVGAAADLNKADELKLQLARP